MNRYLLVDGHNLLFQMFFGMPNSILRNGIEFRGIIGFLGALRKMIRMTEPDRLAVFFDSEDAGDRREKMPAYKANRPDWSAVEAQDNPFSALPYLYNALSCAGIAHAEIHGYETDDVMAAYVNKSSQNEEFTIASWDSDYFQLISERVRILRYRGDFSILCDEETVIKKCGVPPSCYADWKSLVGDHADNIRGAKTIGPKTAAELLRAYGSLSQIIAHKEEIRTERIRRAIADAEERLLQNYELIRLSGELPLPIPTEEMTLPERICGTPELLAQIGL